MQTPNHSEIQKVKVPKHGNRLAFITQDSSRLAVPVGPRFQADVPDWIEPTKKNSMTEKESSSKWISGLLWPIKGWNPQTKRDAVGKGRVDFCHCLSPGSIECIKRHIAEKRIRLQSCLGPAFWKMKFDEMGEDVAKLWNLEEQKKFNSLVKSNPTSQGKSFMKPALKFLAPRTSKDIVSYYFNVYLPRRICEQTRSGCSTIDTDDEARQAPEPKGPRKRCQANSTSESSKYVKNRYLTGRR